MAKRTASVRKSLAVAEPLHSIGFELRKTDRAVEADLQVRLANVGLRIGMWLYLRSLWHEEGLTQSELSQRVGASKPTTLNQLRRMEHRGLIRFERAPTDRRVVRVLLTEEGRALKEKLLPFAQFNHDAAMAGFTEAEIEKLYDALRHIRHNVAGRRFSAVPPVARRDARLTAEISVPLPARLAGRRRNKSVDRAEATPVGDAGTHTRSDSVRQANVSDMNHEVDRRTD